jgi:hypothetical protein
MFAILYENKEADYLCKPGGLQDIFKDFLEAKELKGMNYIKIMAMVNNWHSEITSDGLDSFPSVLSTYITVAAGNK